MSNQVKLTTQPSEFQVTCNGLLEGLRPLREELASLAVAEAEAIRVAHIEEVRQIKDRRQKIHEELLNKSAAAKRELQSFLDAFGPVAEAERKRVDGELEAKKAERAALEREYTKQAAELDQEIISAEKMQHKIWSDMQTINELQITTASQLSDQINESLQAA